MAKSTMTDLVAVLTERNIGGRYDKLIENAKSGRYHDYKNPDDVICGKIEFVNASAKYPELSDVANDIKDGVYDEEADEADKAEMRLWTPKGLWASLGL